MKQVQENVIKQAFGELENTFCNKFYKTSYCMTTTVKFCLSHGKKDKQNLSYFNLKFSIIQKPDFICSYFKLCYVILYL